MGVVILYKCGRVSTPGLARKYELYVAVAEILKHIVLVVNRAVN